MHMNGSSLVPVQEQAATALGFYTGSGINLSLCKLYGLDGNYHALICGLAKSAWQGCRTGWRFDGCLRRSACSIQKASQTSIYHCSQLAMENKWPWSVLPYMLPTLCMCYVLPDTVRLPVHLEAMMVLPDHQGPTSLQTAMGHSRACTLVCRMISSTCCMCINEQLILHGLSNLNWSKWVPSTPACNQLDFMNVPHVCEWCTLPCGGLLQHSDPSTSMLQALL